MDVNSNSHAEQSRNDTHVKDIRPGTLMPHKEKKVTSGVCRHATRSWHNLLSFKTNLMSCVLFSLTPTHHCPVVSFLLSQYGSEMLIWNIISSYIMWLISKYTRVAWSLMILWMKIKRGSISLCQRDAHTPQNTLPVLFWQWMVKRLS